MAKPVVDALEAIKIDKDQADQSPVAVRFDHGPFQTIAKQHAVWQAGDGVEVRQLLQALLGPLTLDHVAELICHRLQHA